ncbi:hypothetical protein D3C86_2111240 [compost metagenome]
MVCVKSPAAMRATAFCKMEIGRVNDVIMRKAMINVRKKTKAEATSIIVRLSLRALDELAIAASAPSAYVT